MACQGKSEGDKCERLALSIPLFQTLTSPQVGTAFANLKKHQTQIENTIGDGGSTRL